MDIAFNPGSVTITCTFADKSFGVAKECLINISYGNNCDEQLGLYTTNFDKDTQALVTPSIELVDTTRYCFSAIAKSGNTTVIIEGHFNIFGINTGSYNPGILSKNTHNKHQPVRIQ